MGKSGVRESRENSLKLLSMGKICGKRIRAETERWEMGLETWTTLFRMISLGHPTKIQIL